mmetsp:Transcript_2649/g.4808  ORF Transcript_2649/g.4808 Transcript_2649/m.4808 type:complete len:353 (-) Transcript_2649:444-1502(-)|eukprot:CAMPEP_0198279898 /NCGR_PEP_ID=MMETSP1449-20131203/97_1 /TAXON_ID=420275 /ORGANISM="Attheya septentrionalis, Strain CCMP2084" /LENGTH=352 /DNA_ID=CAMNT_0043975139 /DNA_START=137 /DNA_END=1195 /DNA_ORIENTATION=+
MGLSSKTKVFAAIAAAYILRTMHIQDGILRTNVNHHDDPELHVSAPYSTGKRSGGGEQPVNHNKCTSLDVDGNMDAIIASAKPIFITMPAKAAGTSLARFSEKCTKQNFPCNLFVNSPDEAEKFLSNTLHLPSIITSHVYAGDQPLVDIVQHSTRKTLIVQIHRDETERLQSGIKQVLTALVCNRVRYKVGSTQHFHIDRNQTHCILDEGPAIDMIKERVQEIGIGSPEILTCKTYKAIEENEPHMIFLHYKQVNKLQRLLAKHHCPELLDEPPMERNVAKGKPMSVYLRLRNGGNVVKLDDWLHAKGDLLEWSLKLRKNATCQAKTRHMEDELFTCPDQAIKVTSEGVRRW